jgi:uncharacterized protein
VKIYLDSCIFIYLVDGPEKYARPISEAIQNNSGASFCLSDLVRLECLVGPLRRGDQAQRKLFEEQFKVLTVLTLSSSVYDLAAELRAQHRLKTPDAIHAAAAILHGCDEFWTNDRRLAAIEPRIVLRVLPNTAAQ